MSIVLITGLGKLIIWLLRLLPGNRGSALPGLVATSLDPNFVGKLAKKNQLKSIIITGTNGKTTTAYLLGNVLKASHVSFIRNSTGSNLLRGVASKLIEQVSLFGSLPVKLAIWEIDEAVVPEAIKQLKPQIVLITNLSRDQLDRYGELDTVLKRWQESFAKLPKNARVIVNAADPRLKVLTWPNLSKFGGALRDRHQDPKLAVEALLSALKLKVKNLNQLVNTFPAPFGRGETFKIAGKTYQLNLVKNPSSFNAHWQTFTKANLNQPLLIQLNDLLADGTDVSWIWDVNFTGMAKRKTPIIVSGTRAYDLALRLKYAGLNPRLIKLNPNPGSGFNQLKRQKGSKKYLFATYTAMRTLRQILDKQS